MKLFDCPACEHKVSIQAKACPHCGHPLEYPVEKSFSGVFWTVIKVVLALGVVWVIAKIVMFAANN